MNDFIYSKKNIYDKLNKIYKYDCKIIGKGTYSSVIKVSNDTCVKIFNDKYIFKSKYFDRSAFSEDTVVREIIFNKVLSHHNLYVFDKIFYDNDIGIYLEGELAQYDLDKFCRSGFSIDEFFNLLESIISVIKYLHSLGLIHSDIKTANILVHKNEYLLCDLNLVQQYSPNNTSEKTKSFATEFFSPINEYRSHLLDIYMLGATLFSCLIISQDRNFYSSHISLEKLIDRKCLLFKFYGMTLRTRIAIEIIQLMLQESSKRIYVDDLEEFIKMIKFNDNSMDIKIMEKIESIKKRNVNNFDISKNIFHSYGINFNYDQYFLHEIFKNKYDVKALINIYEESINKRNVNTINYRFINILGYQFSCIYNIDYDMGKYIAHILLMFPDQISSKTWEVMYGITRQDFNTSIINVILNEKKFKLSLNVYLQHELFQKIYNKNYDDKDDNKLLNLTRNPLSNDDE